jgi:predicted membrane-bound mannosyltransferase
VTRQAQARAHVAGVLLAAVGVGALLRLWALGRQGLWYDEAVTAWLLGGTPGQMLHAVPITESTPPLFYALAWGWVRVLGTTEAGLRSLSAVAGIATVPVAFAAARSLIGLRAGLVAAVLVAVNPFLIWYSQEARAYSLLALLSATGLWLFARARERPGPGRLAAWGTVSALALATHYFAIFAIAPEALMLLLDRRARARWRLLAVGIVGAAGVALLGIAARQTGEHVLYFTHTSLAHRVNQIAHQYLVGFRPPATQPLFLVAAAAVVVAAVLLVWRTEPDERRGAAAVAAVLAGAVAIPILLALAGRDFLNTRNVIAGVVPAMVLLAAGLGARRAGLTGLAAAAVLVAVSLTTMGLVARSPWAQRGRWREVAHALRPAAAGPPQAVLVRGSGSWARTLSHYLPRTWWMKPSGARVAEIDVLRRLPDGHGCHGASWWGAICDFRPEPGLARPPAPGFRLAATERVQGFAIDRWRAPRPVRFRPPPPRPYFRYLVAPTHVPGLPR